jgi:hypothetical protein
MVPCGRQDVAEVQQQVASQVEHVGALDKVKGLPGELLGLIVPATAG